MVAGVKDMRFQALMPDILHWLGITKIDNMVSMSDMKYDAIVKSGIPIKKRYDIPGSFFFFLLLFRLTAPPLVYGSFFFASKNERNFVADFVLNS